ncbi:MAG: TIGR01244 family sulfur transferase [Polymorphobacter sp.]
MFKQLTPAVAVAPQIDVADVTAAAAQGFVCIVNNRPDGESPGQPLGEAIRAAAEAAGMRYVAIPVDARGFSASMVAAMVDALGAGKTLAFCRSGTRSTNLWSLASASQSGSIAEITNMAAAAGYDVSGLAGAMAQLGGQS